MAIPALLGAAIASGVSGLGSSLLSFFGNRETNRANKAIAADTNQANLQLYNMQVENQLEQWNRENAYNTPTMQSARLRAAGLNPALMNGNNPTGVASAASSSMPTAHPAVGYEVQNPFNAFSDLAVNLANSASAFKSFQEGENTRLGNQYVNQEHIKGLALMDANIDYLLKQTKKGSAEYWLLMSKKRTVDLENRLFSETYQDKKQSFRLENDYKQAQINSLEEQIKLSATQRALNESLTALHKTEDYWYGKQMQATIAKMFQDVAVGKATVRNITADTLQKQLQSAGIRISNKQAREILPYIVEQAKYLPTLAEQEYRENEINRMRARVAHDQAEQDLYNPLNWFGKIFGSGGAIPVAKAIK